MIDLHEDRGRRYNRAFGIGVVLNVALVAVELLYGFAADSLALIADAGHNLSDVLTLVVAWGAFLIAEKSPSRRFTYGLRKATILAALGSAIFLLVALGAIAWEAVGRFTRSQPVDGTTVLVVAAIGVGVNAASAWLFVADRETDLNVKGAFLHMVADAAVSLGVVVGAAVVMATGWNWIDPVLSLAIVAVIAVGSWGLLRDSLRLSLDAVPRGLDLDTIEAWIRGRPGVVDLHDLHVWAMSTTQAALTVHVVTDADSVERLDGMLEGMVEGLRAEFGIGHSTVQIERVGGVRDRACTGPCPAG